METIQPPIKWTPIFFMGSNSVGRDYNQSPASSAEIKNEWSCASPPPICLHSMDRENFRFLNVLDYCSLLHRQPTSDAAVCSSSYPCDMWPAACLCVLPVGGYGIRQYVHETCDGSLK